MQSISGWDLQSQTVSGTSCLHGACKVNAEWFDVEMWPEMGGAGHWLVRPRGESGRTGPDRALPGGHDLGAFFGSEDVGHGEDSRLKDARLKERGGDEGDERLMSDDF